MLIGLERGTTKLVLPKKVVCLIRIKAGEWVRTG